MRFMIELMKERFLNSLGTVDSTSVEAFKYTIQLLQNSADFKHRFSVLMSFLFVFQEHELLQQLGCQYALAWS